MTEKKDISRQTIVVLVFLAILVTLLGTLTVMSEVTKVRVPDLSSDTSVSQTQGRVSLTIENSPKVVSTTGTVSLNIEQPASI